MRYYEFAKTNESYTDDTNKGGVLITSPDFNLTVGKFADEQGKLVSAFPVEYDDVVTAIRDFTKESPLNAELVSGRELSKKLQTQYDILLGLKNLHYKLKEEHHIYSGSGKFDPMSAMKDSIFQTPSFISGSLNIEVAAKNNNFHDKKEHNTTDHILHFILPKNYGGCFYIGPYSTTPEELEMIIFPNEKFKLISSKIKEIGKTQRHIHTFVPYN